MTTGLPAPGLQRARRSGERLNLVFDPERVLAVAGDASRSGSVMADGSASFSFSGYGDFGGVAVPMTCNLQGIFTVASDETASGPGKGTCAVIYHSQRNAISIFPALCSLRGFFPWFALRAWY